MDRVITVSFQNREAWPLCNADEVAITGKRSNREIGAAFEFQAFREPDQMREVDC